MHDTTYIDVHDTTYINVPYAVHDTTYINVPYPVHDTIVITETDTLWLPGDTVYIRDTVYDTIYVGLDDVKMINAKIYTHGGQIVIEGTEGMPVLLYDAVGRLLATRQEPFTPLRFDVPASGAYLIKIGDLPARRVVVVR